MKIAMPHMLVECERDAPLRRLAPAGAGRGGGHGEDDDSGPRLDRRILKRLGRHLAALYADLGSDPIPARFHDLLASLGEKVRSASPPSEQP
jgi:hypothetical protein